jgi:hypothetical protein
LVRKAIWSAALATGLTLIVSIYGIASVSAQKISTEPSPYQSCPTDSQTGRLYLSGEEEPQVAISKSTGTMIAMYHQDRWSNGGANGIGVSIFSGGTWAPTSTFPDDMCAAGTPDSLSFYQRSSDPWVSFSKDGDVAYASALAFDNTDNKNSVAVGTWTADGGWSNMQPIQGSIFKTLQSSTDKNSTTADPLHNDIAYTVWDTLIEPQDQIDANLHTAAYTGPAYFSKTTDGGGSWSPAQIIINTPQRQQTIGNIIVVDPRNDDLYDFTDLITTPNTPFQGTRSTESVAFVKSTDGGLHWTSPQVIAPFNSLGVVDPNTGALLRTGDGLEEVAIDPSSGELFVVWQSSTNYTKNLKQSSGAYDNEIMLTTSSTSGMSWTTPRVVHTAPNSSGVLMPTYTPTVAVNGGKVAITYYDNRNLPAGDTSNLPTDYWVSEFDESTLALIGEQHIAGSFDELSAPVARGFFLGDYEGLQPSGSGFEAVFVATNCTSADGGVTFTGKCGAAEYAGGPTTSGNDNPTDVFAAAIS